MRYDKPTSLMMKSLYSLLIDVGEKPGEFLSKLSHQEVKNMIDELKRRARYNAKLVSNDHLFHEKSVRTIDTSSNEELTWIGNQLSLSYFARPCKIPISWDKSLKNAAGLFSYDERSRKPIRIVQSIWQYNQFGAQHVIGTLKHELAHYHLFLAGKAFRDGEVDFIMECQRIGAPLYALSMQEGYVTSCSSCGKFTGLEKKERKKQLSRCCKQPVLFGSYLLIFPDGIRVEVEK